MHSLPSNTFNSMTSDKGSCRVAQPALQIRRISLIEDPNSTIPFFLCMFSYIKDQDSLVLSHYEISGRG